MRLPRSRCSLFLSFTLFAALLTLFAACGGSPTTPGNNSSNTASSKQVLRYPNVGTTDVGKLDPASGPDSNSNQAINMIFTGLVKSDKDLNVVPDQATWDVSDNNKVYTFHLKQGITFSDGTPVTAQTYVYTWTRNLLPEVKSPVAPVLEESIVGATDVNSGKSKTLTGVQAVDDHTLKVTLVRPTAYFLQVLTVSLFYPLNQKLIEQYGQANWTQHVAGNAAGTGPFMVKSWEANSRMVLVPNPHYYGSKTKLSEVDMLFVKDPSTALKSYRAGQYDFVWGIIPDDQAIAKSLPGFIRKPILQTDSLFFNNKMAPFDKTPVRQAFAAAIDKQTLSSAILHDAVTPASTIVPPGEPGSQADYAGIPFDKAKAKSLLQSVYPDLSKVPPVTFTYPSGQMSNDEAAALQQMWQQALGIQVKLQSVELTAYNDMTTKRTVQFGFTQWSVYFPDPYEWLDLSLLSTAGNNNGNWNNPDFDKTVAEAEQSSGEQRLALYAKAERIAIDNVGWLPLDHQSMAAVFPPKVHGISLNGQGLYFGDWSDVYLTQ
ncbi:peptide ABC transporter substrate-binding protein [Ktedonosporobacter rubrisoli]|uniref:Peptide ABC transporter substrate-binding protein n=1 Tax=Ktedonosporobacter rubrisoli TaxID=2509675 RepID=A0A4P6K557_KTERU|nr:peptide ABC transporter substrate-binding protein [Ktedonosporobacter rubrisoli]QBD83112.1 peptide ABC transporter substrate-binding protein [Ktedonosporobacter rubrisoli]